MSESGPIGASSGRNDYERYLKIPDLLACQKPPSDLAHRDELMFQIVHQTAELWMKLQIHELVESRDRIRRRDCLGATVLLHRVTKIQQLLVQQLHILETMSPWDYQEIRKVLGQGSGLESPGFQRLVLLGPTLWGPFQALMEEEGSDIDRVYTERERFPSLYLTAEALADYDEHFQIWRFHHLKLVEREIGGKVTSLKGTAIDFLGENLDQRFYPELWDVRNRLTHRAGSSYR